MAHRATDVVVGAETTVSGRDAQIAPASHIRGTVTAPAGTGVVQVLVTAHRYDPSRETWNAVAWDGTEFDGSYDLAGLPAGTYRLRFTDSTERALATEYWNDQPDIESAQDIVVTAGDAVTGKDAQLATAGSISGRITDTDGVGVQSSLVVYRLSPAGQFVETASEGTTSNGRYSIPRLPAGTYRLEIKPTDGHADEFYEDATTLASATDIVVGAGEAVAGRDAVVDRLANALRSTAPPTIGGTPEVGRTLTASTGSWTPAPDAVSYQWRAAGVPIAGATDASYVPVVGDVGKTLSVQVHATKVGYDGARAVSTDTAAVAPTPGTTPPSTLASTRRPAITGKATVGRKLKVTTGAWTSPRVRLAYQWLAGGRVIKGATKASLLLRRAHAGARITVRVTASASGFTPTTVTIRAAKKVKAKKRPTRVAHRTVAPTTA